MAMKKFSPVKGRFLSGYWRPEEGDVCKGVIVEVAEGQFGPYLIVRLSEPLVVGQRNRETREVEDYEAQKDDEVGVNVKAGLRGLEKYVGHGVVIRYLGMKPESFGSRTIDVHAYDVDVTDAPVANGARTAPKPAGGSRGAKKSEAKKADAPAPGASDDDIPF